MSRQTTSLAGIWLSVTLALWLTSPLVCQTRGAATVSSAMLRATAIVGPGGSSSDTTGELSIDPDALLFHRTDGPSTRIPLASIYDISLSREDKQLGGTPMALGRAAAPFGGGRAIGLLAHKQYDILTVEYGDSYGGLHGMVFQLKKGQAQPLADVLAARGVHVSGSGVNTPTGKQEATNHVQ